MSEGHMLAGPYLDMRLGMVYSGERPHNTLGYVTRTPGSDAAAVNIRTLVGTLPHQSCTLGDPRVGRLLRQVN